jgi:hypothetical protein
MDAYKHLRRLATMLLLASKDHKRVIVFTVVSVLVAFPLLTTCAIISLTHDRSSLKRPNDVRQLVAASILVAATNEASPAPVDDGKGPAAVALGRKSGKKGGPARAAALIPNAARGSRRRRSPPVE